MNTSLPTSLFKRKSLLTILAITALILFNSNVYGQYTISQPAWEGLETLTAPTSVFPADDQTVGPYNIGFDFNFFGVTYSTFYISSNGFISFQNTANGCCSGQFIPNTGQPNNMIAAFYEDYDPPEGGSIRYQTLGTSPNRMLVVEFNGVYPWNGPPKTPSTWQLKIKECSNEIDIACLSCNSDGGAHTQGVENAAGTQAFFVAGRNSVDFSLTNDLVRFSPTGSSSFDQIDLNDQFISLEENTNSGVQVVDLDDPSSTSSVEYSIIDGNDLGYFAINSSTGEITTTSYIDFEQLLGLGATSFDLEILAEDTDNCLNFDNAIITVEIENQEEDQVTIAQTNLTNLVTNNSVAQSFLTSEAKDLVEVAVYLNSSPGSLTLNIYKGTDPVNKAAKSVANLIHSENFSGVGTGVIGLELTEKVSLDEDEYYTFEIESTANFSMWYYNDDIYIPGDAFFNDVLQPTRDLYFDLTLATFNAAPQIDAIPNQEVTENNDSNDAIYVVQAEDPDGDDISYSLVGGGGFFFINPNSGEIFTNGSLDYETVFANTTASPIEYSINVTATDNGAVPKSASTSFVVSILNEEGEDYSIEQLTGNITLNGNTSIGQSFTTTDAGYITNIGVNVITPPSSGMATLQIWKDSDTNTTSGGTGPGHVETNLIFETQVEITSNGYTVFDIDEDVYLESNTVYSFEMFGTNLNLQYRSSNLYRRGRILWSNQLYGCCDLYFSVAISQESPSGAGGNVELLAPSNGQNLPDQSQYVTFTWSADPRTLENNTLYVLIETAGEEPFISEPLNNVTSYQLALEQLSKGKIYRWSIINEEGDQTEERLFKTPLIVVTANTEAFNGSVRTYPNPFNDRFIISVENEVEERLFVQIVDLMGREIYHETSGIKSNNYQFEIAGGAFNKGVYLTRLFSVKNNGAKELLYQGKLVKN